MVVLVSVYQCPEHTRFFEYQPTIILPLIGVRQLREVYPPWGGESYFITLQCVSSTGLVAG